MSNYLWTSERLVYRAADEDSDAQFMKDMLMSDQTDFEGSVPFAPKPLDLEDTKEFMKLFKQSKIAVIVCLPAESKAAAATGDAPPAVPPKDDEAAKKAKDPEPKPTPIGFVALQPVDPKLAHHRNAVLGIHLRHNYTNKGYGTEMLKWMMNWGFKYGGLHKINLSVYTWNPRAIHVYEKVGFVTEGRLREQYWVEGEFRDGLTMGILEQEWRAKYPEDAKPRPY